MEMREQICEMVARALDSPECDGWVEQKEEFENLRWRPGSKDPREIMDFVKRCKGLPGLVIGELTREVTAYVTERCQYFAEIAAYRPFTEEEREEGRHLREMLMSMSEFISACGPASDNGGAAPTGGR